MSSGTRELYLAILSVLAAGAAYVPVDADDPEERADDQDHRENGRFALQADLSEEC